MDNLTVIVPFWNGHATIGRLLDSLPASLPVIIVDDQSDEPLHINRDNVSVIRPDKRGYFSGAVNVGLDACQSDVLVLNQDVWLEGDAWLNILAEKRDEYALIGDPAGKHPAWPDRYVQGTFMFMRRDAIERVGKLNEMWYPLWGATAEWQTRACRKGFRPLVLDTDGWLHHEQRHGRFGQAITEAIKREPNREGWFTRTPPDISVIVPCYNHGKYLADCVGSLVGGETCLGHMEGQSFQGFEVIIVDDASTDDTEQIGKALADRQHGIRYMRHSHNKGTPWANNTGIERAYGHAIMILAADDMLESWTLEKMFDAYLKNPHGVIYGHLHAFKDGERGQMFQLAPYDFEQLLRKNMMSAGIMFQKRAWKEVGGYPTLMTQGREDWAFNIALGIYGWCGVHIGDSGYLYRREGQNRSVRTATSQMWQTFQQQLRNLYPKIYAGERPMACCGQGNPGRKPERKIIGGKGGGNPGLNLGGMVQIEYIGRNAGDMTWQGVVSRRKYSLGGVTRFGWIDSRDLSTGRSSAPGLLELVDGRNKVFRLVPVREPEPAPVVVEEKPVARRRGRRKSVVPEPEQTPTLRDIEGIGPATEKKLIEAGLTTPASLVHISIGELAEIIGPRHAGRIWEAASAFVD